MFSFGKSSQSNIFKRMWFSFNSHRPNSPSVSNLSRNGPRIFIPVLKYFFLHGCRGLRLLFFQHVARRRSLCFFFFRRRRQHSLEQIAPCVGCLTHSVDDILVQFCSVNLPLHGAHLPSLCFRSWRQAFIDLSSKFVCKTPDSVWRQCRYMIVALLLQLIHGWRESFNQFNGGAQVDLFCVRCVVIA